MIGQRRCPVGKLVLINSTIGDLDDLSVKVRRALEEGRYFAVEDTRKFKHLLRNLDIAFSDKVIESFHDHSELSKLHKILARLKEQDVYVASDGGSPIISDPAFSLVCKALEQGREVVSYSGVSSVLCALEISGLPPHPFSFWGFLPRGQSKRIRLMENLSKGTHIFFEAPHRLEKTLEELTSFYPTAPFVLAKELTKKHQRIERFKGEEWIQLKDSWDGRGEFVVMLYLDHLGERGAMVDYQSLRSAARDILDQGIRPKRVVKLLAKILSEDSKEIYKKLKDVDKRI